MCNWRNRLLSSNDGSLCGYVRKRIMEFCAWPDSILEAWLNILLKWGNPPECRLSSKVGSSKLLALVNLDNGIMFDLNSRTGGKMYYFTLQECRSFLCKPFIEKYLGVQGYYREFLSLNETVSHRSEMCICSEWKRLEFASLTNSFKLYNIITILVYF